MDVMIDAVDRRDPVPMCAEIVAAPAGMPIVEYLHPSTLAWQLAPTVLGFSGGCMSGAMMALLAEALAAHGIRLVAFDMPGHTPPGLLGRDTPPRALVSQATGAIRRLVGATMIQRWQPHSTSIQLLSHSAGILDIASLIGEFGPGIERFVIAGASIPGLAAMARATKASAAARSMTRIRLSHLVRTRSLPATAAAMIYGPTAKRVLDDAALARYDGPEHLGVPMRMLRSRLVLGEDWRGRRVLLIGSAGDAVVPAAAIRQAHWRLRGCGAQVQSAILPLDLPHAFLSFTDGAYRSAEIIAEGTPSP